MVKSGKKVKIFRLLNVEMKEKILWYIHLYSFYLVSPEFGKLW